jgi:hypothetical protein
MPNTKVVANIQIHLHAKFHIFLRSPSISTILFSPADLLNWKNDLNWKNHCGPFSPWPPQLSSASAQSSRRSWPVLSASSGCYQVSPDVSWTHTSASLLHGRKTLHTRPTIAPCTLPYRPLSSAPALRRSPAQFWSTGRPRAMP